MDVLGWANDLLLNLQGKIGNAELARIEAENQALQRKALERAGASPADIDAYLRQGDVQIERDLMAQGVHPSQATLSPALQRFLSVGILVAGIGGVLYFGYKFYAASKGK